MLQAFYSNMFSISFSVNSVLELFLTTNIVYNTLYKEGGLSMKPYLFRLEQECEHLAATEYIYEIGTFHYNWHKDLEILVILKGSVEVCTENKLFFLEEDDVILINSNEGHATFSKTPESVAFLFRLDPDFLEKYIPGYQYICFKLRTDAESKNMFSYCLIRKYMAQMIIAKMKEPLEDELLFRSAFYGLLNLLTKEFSHKESKNLLGLEKSTTDIHKIILYIEEHYREKLSLDEIAEYFGYNSSYFSQMFRSSVGINFYEFLTRRRLREAVRELDRTNKKILDIANDTGFPNLKAFNTRFRELFERTPSEYRSSLKQVRVRDSLNYKQAYINAGNAEITEKLNQYASFNELPFSYPVTLQEASAPSQTSSAFSQKTEKTLDDVSRQLTELSSKLKALKNTHL